MQKEVYVTCYFQRKLAGTCWRVWILGQAIWRNLQCRQRS